MGCTEDKKGRNRPDQVMSTFYVFGRVASWEDTVAQRSVLGCVFCVKFFLRYNRGLQLLVCPSTELHH